MSDIALDLLRLGDVDRPMWQFMLIVLLPPSTQHTLGSIEAQYAARLRGPHILGILLSKGDLDTYQQRGLLPFSF